MAIFGAMNGLISADASSWNNAMDTAGKKVEELEKRSSASFKKTNDAVKKTVGEKSSWLDKLAAKEKLENKEKKQSGESALEGRLRSGEFFLDKIGAGGVKGVVVDYIGKSFANVTNKAVEVRDALASGAQDLKGALNEITQSIPVLGGFVQGFNNLRELATGEKAAIAEIKKEAAAQEAVNDAVKKRMDLVKQLKKDYQALENAILSQERGLTSLQLTGSGPAKQKFDIDSSTIAQKTANKTQMEAAIEKSNKEFDDIKQTIRTQRLATNDTEQRRIFQAALDNTMEQKAEAEKQLRAKYGRLDYLAGQSGEQQKSLVDMETGKQLNKVRLGLEKSYLESMHKQRQSSLKENEYDTTAYLEDLQHSYMQQADDLVKGTRDTIRSLGESEYTPAGKELMASAMRGTEQLAAEYNQAKQAYLAAQRKSMLDGLRTPEENFTDGLNKLKLAFGQKIISAAQLAEAQKRFTENAAKGITDSVATPEEKYQKQIETLKKQFVAKMIDAPTLARAAYMASQQLSQEELTRNGGAVSTTGVEGRVSLGYSSPKESTAITTPQAELSRTAKEQLKATIDLTKLTQEQLDLEKKNVHVTISMN